MEPAAWELYESGDPNDEVRIILRLLPGADPPATVHVVSRFGDVVTARVRRGDIIVTRQAPEVASLKAGGIVVPPSPFENEAEDGEVEEMDGAEIGVDDDWDEGTDEASAGVDDGRGVVVGICDWGLDFTHPNLRNPDGTTRLLCLWDQRGTGDSRAPSPAPFNDGRLFTRDAINAALREPDPCAALGYHPADADPTNTGSHGTHVADILAGNRREPGSRVGLAAAADLVFVHLGATHLGELGNLGDSIGLLEGLDFVRRQAAGRPCVLHLSAGKTGGPHRGDTLLERAVDAMLHEPGIVLIQSVGNYAASAMHTHARVGPDQHHTINWLTPQGDRTPNELEIWYSGDDVFDVTAVSPDGRAFTVALGQRMPIGDGTTTWGNFYHRLHEPNSGLNHVVVYLYTSAPNGHWRILIHGRDVVDGRLHAWIERDVSGRYQSRFLHSQATSRFTTNTICNCFRAIAVGAYDATRPDRPPTVFSSRGPTADGRQKPEIAAPGFKIRAARSVPRNGWHGEPRLCVKSGTSMAAPAVSGTVALMFAAAGRPLTIHEIRRALIGTADPHSGPSGRSSTQLGYGYLNTRKAVEAARRIGGMPTSQSSEGLPVDDREVGDTAYPPVWVEDAADGIDVDPRDGIVFDEGFAPPGAMEMAVGVPADAVDAGQVVLEDEVEPIDAADDANEGMETPLVWEDIREAIAAVEGDGG